MGVDPAPFTIAVADEVLEVLRTRLRSTRWPEAAPGAPWEQGTDLTFLQALVRTRAEDFDWRGQERRLNAYPHFTTEIEGTRVHFVHQREWYERLYDIEQWTVAPEGGHFAAAEVPDALARDIRAHFGGAAQRREHGTGSLR